MKIGFQAPDSEFANAIFDILKSKLPNHTWTRWAPGAPPPARDAQALLALGPVTGELMDQLRDLALVQTLSDGYENVDVNAATQRGIRVSYAPGDVTGNADSVAEYAVLLMLAAARRLSTALTAIRDHGTRVPAHGRALIGRNVCIVGIGSIGTKIAHRLLTFGVKLTAVDAAPAHAPKSIPTVTPDRIKEAVADADFVVLAVRATAENTHMIDAGVLAAMKKGAFLINIARGSLVDEKALYEAIKSGQLAGAGLDVEEHEPIPPNDPLLTLPQVFLTPHQAGLTELNIHGTADYVADVLAKFEAGKPIESQLNHPQTPRSLKTN
jgi:phosphoglycerate dehydrogenase-like enzyme